MVLVQVYKRPNDFLKVRRVLLVGVRVGFQLIVCAQDGYTSSVIPGTGQTVEVFRSSRGCDKDWCVSSWCLLGKVTTFSMIVLVHTHKDTRIHTSTLTRCFNSVTERERNVMKVQRERKKGRITWQEG